MSIFGSSYPPGAASDPFAPYNQEEQPDNSVVEAAFVDRDGPGEVYRVTYKYVDCGPSVGFRFQFTESVPPDGIDDWGGERWVYCDDLYKFGTWKDVASRGELITGISVSSIVEGVDQCTETHVIEINPFDFEAEPDALRKQYDEAVEAVNVEASDIWNATHGCGTCCGHWLAEGFDPEFEDGVPVWDECPDCHGHGEGI